MNRILYHREDIIFCYKIDYPFNDRLANFGCEFDLHRFVHSLELRSIVSYFLLLDYRIKFEWFSNFGY